MFFDMPNPYNYPEYYQNPITLNSQNFASNFIYNMPIPNGMIQPPTYGMYPDMLNVMPTPFGGSIFPLSQNLYNQTLFGNPFIGGTLTYGLGILAPPVGVNPNYYTQMTSLYNRELLTNIESGLLGFGGATLGGILGSFGGPIGIFVGSAIGGILGQKAGDILDVLGARSIMFNQSTMMLNTGRGELGLGLSYGESNILYKSFIREGVKHPFFSSEEQLLSATELMKNDLIITGSDIDFTSIKHQFKKLNNLVRNLRDLFDGSIKDVVTTLRQFMTSGVSMEDIDAFASGAGVAAVQMGMKTKDYVANLINESNTIAPQIKMSKGIYQYLSEIIDSSPGLGRLYEVYGAGAKDNILRYKQDLMKVASILNNNPAQFLSLGIVAPNMGIAVGAEYALEQMKKSGEISSDVTFSDIAASEQLRDEIFKSKYFQDFQKNILPDARKVRELELKYFNLDKSFLATVINPSRLADFVSEIPQKEVAEMVLRTFSAENLIKLDKYAEDIGDTSLSSLVKRLIKSNIKPEELITSFYKKKKVQEDSEKELQYIRDFSLEAKIKRFFLRLKERISNLLTDGTHITNIDNKISKKDFDFLKEHISEGVFDVLNPSKVHFVDEASLPKGLKYLSPVTNLFTYAINGLLNTFSDQHEVYLKTRIMHLTGENSIYTSGNISNLLSDVYNKQAYLRLIQNKMHYSKSADEIFSIASKEITPIKDRFHHESVQSFNNSLKEVVKELERFKTKINQSINSLDQKERAEVLNRFASISDLAVNVSKGGMLALLRSLGYTDEVTAEEAKSLANKLKDSPELKEKAASYLSKVYHVDKKLAEKILDSAISFSSSPFMKASQEEAALIFNSWNNLKHIVKEDSLIAHAYSSGLLGEISQYKHYFKDISELTEKISKYGNVFIGKDKESHMMAVLTGAAKGISVEQQKYLHEFMNILKDFFKEAGGHVRINGKEVSLQEAIQDPKIMKQLITNLQGGKVLDKFAHALGLPLLPDNVKDIHTLVNALKMNREGHFVIDQKYFKGHKKEITEAIRHLGLGVSANDIGKIINLLNSGGGLARTNALLSNIDKTLNEINRKTDFNVAPKNKKI